MRKRRKRTKDHGAGTIYRMEPGDFERIVMKSKRPETWPMRMPGYAFTSLCPDPEYRR